MPFLDINANGKRDNGEPKAFGLNLRANGGIVEKSDRDSTIRILGLEPYTNCFIELDPNSFENISWRLPVKTLNVVVDPNILKNIEIPVTIAGEATGTVTILKDGESKGSGRIIISFFTENLKPAGKTITEDDGYFSFFGLAPGEYTVRVDTSQLRKLNMTSDPGSRRFKITAGIEGDYIGDLDFTLGMIPGDTIPAKPVVVEKPVT